MQVKWRKPVAPGTSVPPAAAVGNALLGAQCTTHHLALGDAPTYWPMTLLPAAAPLPAAQCLLTGWAVERLRQARAPWPRFLITAPRNPTPALPQT